MLPGDELIPEPTWSSTRAISVAAPAADVWPWIAQIGQERGGFSSFERLENLFGCRITNSDVIVDAWQHPAVGDTVHLHPKGPPLHVALVEPGRHLVLHGNPRSEHGEPAADPGAADTTWALVLRDDGPGRCRLIERNRTVHGDSIGQRLSFGTALVEPIGFVMSREMLRSIASHAESSVGSDAALRQ